MSGGHYDYVQFNLRDLAERVHRDAGVLLTGEEAPGVVSRMLLTAKLLRAAGDALHALDWWMSGDTNSGDFAAGFDEAMKRFDGDLLPERAKRTLEALRRLDVEMRAE